MLHPQKPRLTLRIGITGHRPNRLSREAPEALANDIRQLLKNIRATLAAVHKEQHRFFADEAPRLILVSSLAEGADRIAAAVADDLGIELYCPLPFLRAEYERDFPEPAARAAFHHLLSKASVFELEGSRASRQDEDRAYEAAGLFVLRQSDLVLSVWNGEGGAGRGGTHDIVQAAVSAGIPVVRYDEQGASPILLLSDDGAAQDARDLIRDAPPASPERLDALLRTLAEPPSDGTAKDARDRVRDYFVEIEKAANPWLVYPAFLRVLANRRGVWASARPEPYVPSTLRKWNAEYWQPIAGACSVGTQRDPKELLPANIAEVLQPRFAWADGLAIYYGQAYRSSYILAFALAPLAVLCAVLPLPVHLLFELGGEQFAHSWKNTIESVAAALALLAIAGVAALVRRGWRTRRHERWLDYRLLAERLRVIRVLALTGSPMPELRVPHTDERLKSQQSWVTWYVRATLREIGIPRGVGNAAYADLAKCALVAAELDAQTSYHEGSAERERRIGERLEDLGLVTFGLAACLTVIALVYFVFFASNDEEHAHKVASIVMFFTALLPALGAAIFAIRSYGEFERNVRVSEATQEKLKSISRRLNATAPATFVSVSRATDDTALVLTSELSDWRFIFWGKPLTLPG